MAAIQGDIAILDDPLAQELLRSAIPARVAYTWRDGTPRVVPIWFHWTGEELVLGTPPTAPKVEILPERPEVAITIDGTDWPYKALLIRGTARVEMVDGVAPEYAAAARRYFGEEGGAAWVGQVGGLFPQMARIAIRPTWASILDFEARFPSAIARAMAGPQI